MYQVSVTGQWAFCQVSVMGQSGFSHGSAIVQPGVMQHNAELNELSVTAQAGVSKGSLVRLARIS